MLRAAKPKLTLTVPGAAVGHPTPKSPYPLTASASPMNSPTSLYTAMNIRGISTGQQPTFIYKQCPNMKGILKKDSSKPVASTKRIQFLDTPVVTCVTPMPEGYHGEYVKMSREDRRWVRAD
jgi:hypothetical protein